VPGVECIQVVQHFNFNVGNAIKYLWRHTEKGNAIQDLKKAIQYIEFEIQRIEGEAPEETLESLIEETIIKRYELTAVSVFQDFIHEDWRVREEDLNNYLLSEGFALNKETYKAITEFLTSKGVRLFKFRDEQPFWGGLRLRTAY